MKAKTAALILLFGLSAAAQAHPGHHHSNTFEQPPAAHNGNAGGNQGGNGGGKLPSEASGGVSNQGGGNLGTGGGMTEPVPEPETYAMLMAGLAMVAGIARRRKRQQESRIAGGA